MMPTKSESSPVIRFDRSTLVPIGLLITVVLSAIGATSWIVVTVLEMRHSSEKSAMEQQGQYRELSAKVDGLVALVERSNNGHISRDEWRSWCELLKARNPAMEVPRPGN